MGWFHRSPLIKNERASSATVSPWDDGGLASPRRGEVNRIGELYPSKIYSLFSPCEIRIRNLGVVGVDFNI